MRTVDVLECNESSRFCPRRNADYADHLHCCPQILIHIGHANIELFGTFFIEQKTDGSKTAIAF